MVQETKHKVMSGNMEGRGKVNTDEKVIREGRKRIIRMHYIHAWLVKEQT